MSKEFEEQFTGIETPSAAAMFGIKSPQILLEESRKMQSVHLQTLKLFSQNIQDVIFRNRKPEVMRSKKRIEEKLIIIKQLNQQINEYMVQIGLSCDEIAQFSYKSETELDEYEDIVIELSELLQPREVRTENEISTVGVTVQKAQLPKLQITKYAGEPLRWREFWEQFNANIHMSPLDATTKFSYLRELLVGKAAAVIRGLGLSARNYAVALEKLQQEFGDDNRLRSAHVKAIRDVHAITSAYNLKQLRRFYEDISINYASLESMGYESHVICLVEETVMKLPRQIRYELTKDDRNWSKWTFTVFLERLWGYLKTCEEIEPAETTRNESFTPRRAAVNMTTSKPKECVYCKGSHRSFECTTVSSVADRKALLQQQRRCFNCTRENHAMRECKSKNLCYHCRGKHHSSICTRNSTNQEEESPSSATDSVGHIKSGPVAYQTVQATIGGHLCRILLDTGSGGSYISREHARKLTAKPIRKENRIITTVNGEMDTECPIYNLEVAGVRQTVGHFKTEFAVLDLFKLSTIQNVHPEIQRQRYHHLKGIWFSDVSSDEELEIHAILGVKDLSKIRTGNIIKGKDNEPIAEETTLGWTLMGPLPEQTNDYNFSHVNLMIEQPISVQENFKQLYDLDVLGIEDSCEEDIYADFKDNITRDSDGRYCVKLPWKKGNFFLPDNKQLCESRLNGQLRRLRRTPEDLTTYNAIIEDQIKEGIVEPVPELSQGKKIHYLPHHPVIRREAETTKMRIVYDASAKEHKYSKSLNDCLHIGPPLQPLLFDILLRFRMYPVALLGDIEKAFLQIKVHEQDRDAMRFLWPKNIKDENSAIQELRFTRVIFGSGPSPFLLNATIREHINLFKEDPKFVSLVTKSLYVDDFVSGANTIDEAKELKKKLTERFKTGHFLMRKWKSNEPQLREEILGRSDKEQKIDKVLGVTWNQQTDVMGVNFEAICKSVQEPTQRGLLRAVAAIFDPLGVASPVTILAKAIYHEVCLQKNGWDAEIRSELLHRWQKWLKGLAEHQLVTFQRSIIAYPQEEITKIQLHGFADSSTIACCAAIYLVITQHSGTYVKLLTAKSRVAKPNTSVPRLELIGAQMLAKLIQNVKSAINYDIQETYGWLDSQTVLCWLRNNGEWKQFVRRRVDQILEMDIKWVYCPTDANPADLGTRGTTPLKLQANKDWWQGPEWLTNSQQWPVQEINYTEETEEERRKPTIVAVVISQTPRISDSIEIQRYSSGKKLFRVTAWVLRFIKKSRKLPTEQLTILSVNEVREAKNLWVKEAQKMHEPSLELKRQLGLCLDSHQVFRCHGRFNFREDQQPVYLPKKHKLVELVIMDAHRRMLHTGVASTLAELRSEFWVPNGRQMVKRIIKACFHCRRYSAQPFKHPATSAIPEFRSTPGYAFQCTGVDFAGPLYCKEGKKETKAYLTLFTCATTRAIHLELAEDMTAKTFRRSFKGLLARRGTPQMMVSDNAKSFKATAQWLKKFYEDQKIQNVLHEQKIQWKFNLSRSPWWGGFFERMIGLVKNTMKKILGQARLSFVELKEVFLDIEFCLNNRPLTYQGSEFESEALTPNHLVHGRRIKPLPEEEIFSDEEQPARKRLRYVQQCRDRHWKRWSKEYIQSLREHHTIVEGGKNIITEGDIVLIHDENLPRNHWKFGRVICVIKGKDGVIRGATLKTTTKGVTHQIERPIQKLYPMELKAESSEKDLQSMCKSNEKESTERSTRRSALEAKSIIKAVQIDEDENQV